MRKFTVLLAIVILSLVAGCQKKQEEIKSGAKAPDFVLSDINGRQVKLSDYRGKVVLLEFWATWCPPCIMSIPELNDIQAKYMDKDFVILGISIDDDIEALKAFYQEHTITYTVLFDNQRVDGAYGIYTVPTTIIIGRDGVILSRNMGYAPDSLEQFVQEALGPVKTPPPTK